MFHNITALMFASPSCGGFLSESTNGLSIAAYNFAYRIAKEGATVRVANWGDVPGCQTIPLWAPTRRMTADAITVMRYHLRSNKDISVVHAHTNFTDFVSIATNLAPEYPDIPFIVTMHSPFVSGITTHSVRDKMPKALRAVYLTCPGAAPINDASKYFGINFPATIIPNLPPNILGAESKQRNSVAVVSRIDYIKNPVATISAAVAYARKKKLRVEVVGDFKVIAKSSRQVEISKKVRALIDQNFDIITEHGRLPRQGVADLMARSRVLFHLARAESQGLVAWEANRNGTPVVGLKSVLSPLGDKQNIFVDDVKCARNIDAIDEKISKLTPEFITTEYLRLHSDSQVLQRWRDFYEKVIHDRGV